MLIILWIVFIIVIAIILSIFHLIPLSYNFIDSVAIACGNINVWILSLGITLLFRSYLYKQFFNIPRYYSPWTAISYIMVGLIWISLTVGGKIIQAKIVDKQLEQYKKSINN